jgi:hypothetical protein
MMDQYFKVRDVHLIPAESIWPGLKMVRQKVKNSGTMDKIKKCQKRNKPYNQGRTF